MTGVAAFPGVSPFQNTRLYPHLNAAYAEPPPSYRHQDYVRHILFSQGRQQVENLLSEKKMRMVNLLKEIFPLEKKYCQTVDQVITHSKRRPGPWLTVAGLVALTFATLFFPGSPIAAIGLFVVAGVLFPAGIIVQWRDRKKSYQQTHELVEIKQQIESKLRASHLLGQELEDIVQILGEN